MRRQEGTPPSLQWRFSEEIVNDSLHQPTSDSIRDGHDHRNDIGCLKPDDYMVCLSNRLSYLFALARQRLGPEVEDRCIDSLTASIAALVSATYGTGELK